MPEGWPRCRVPVFAGGDPGGGRWYLRYGFATERWKSYCLNVGQLSRWRSVQGVARVDMQAEKVMSSTCDRRWG